MTADEEMEVALRYRAKVVLRKRARGLRGSIPAAAAAERSKKIVANVEKLLETIAPKTISLFYPIEGSNEVDLRPLDASLRARGVRVAYPSIEAAREEDEGRVAARRMTFRFVDDPERMIEHGLGFREPAPDAEEASALDVLIVPALMIDPRGHRLGYGAGFYDRTIVRYAPPAKTVGVCFDFQLVPDLPDTPGDTRLERIVTDAQALVVAS